ncbi:DinB family protein [Terrimonas sp. NA20]|uniref:DinB family protein n=1 Tax=Terrimonas ginsenosidimutans TaxID=2908004 RepID=A0ABS9KXI2_9BACT|nr:DinB family protein [Terrimonas ginsenosidimutans]MCG2617052.1 DinB family protein [Terrimonas ginsenosidimutans]
MNQAVDTWQISNRINQYLINAIPEEHFADQAVSKGRTVGEQLAHIHNVRLMWLQASMPELMSTVTKIEKDAISKTQLVEQFDKSADAISKLLEKGLADGKIKGFKPHAQAFLGYLIAHEAHHRGQIVLSLKQSGHHLDKKILFGLWEWGTK